MDGEEFGVRADIGYPIDFKGTPVADDPASSPVLGGHTVEYLEKAGVGKAAIEELLEGGLVVQHGAKMKAAPPAGGRSRL